MAILKEGTPVHVRRCAGLARVVKYFRIYKVYLLDQPMTVVYPGGPEGVPYYSAYWTFPGDDLTPVELKGESDV